MHFKHILVTTDFSEDSKAAFDLSAYESRMEDSKITLLNVYEEFAPPIELNRQIWNPEALSQLKQEYVEAATAKLNGFAKNHFHGQEVKTEAIMSTTSVATQIAEYAKDKGCDLIVMASHGKGALGTVFLGSVVQRVLRESPCPVLVIPRAS